MAMAGRPDGRPKGAYCAAYEQSTANWFWLDPQCVGVCPTNSWQAATT